jgi:hypothetical protein
MTDHIVLSTPEPSQLARLAEIQAAAFAQDPLTVAGLPGVSHAEHAAWAEQGFLHLRAPPGFRAELICATKKDTGEIVGFAQWAIPLESDPHGSLAPAPAPGSQPPRPPFPAKANTQVWKEFIEGVIRCEQEVMGETKHWSTLPFLRALVRRLTVSTRQPSCALAPTPLSHVRASVVRCSSGESSAPPRPTHLSSFSLQSQARSCTALLGSADANLSTCPRRASR